LTGDYKAVQTANGATNGQGLDLLTGSAGRDQWLELYKAVDECLPDDKDEIQDVRLQNRVRIFSLKARFHADLAVWYNKLGPNAKDYLDETERKTPPTGPGWVVTLRGEHMHDETLGTRIDKNNPEIELKGRGAGYLYDHFVRQLQQWAVPSHDASGEVGVRKIGISYATITWCPLPERVPGDPFGKIIPGAGSSRDSGSPWGRASGGEGRMMGGGRGGGRGGGAGGSYGGNRPRRLGSPDEAQGDKPSQKEMELNHFVVEFVWRPDNRPAAPPAAPAGPAVATTAAPAVPVAGAVQSKPGTAGAPSGTAPVSPAAKK
jgi:hypothetical protein